MLEESNPLGIGDEREVVELWSSLRREIRRRGVDPETADDLAQESWLRTLRAPPARDGRALGGWLHVVGARLVSEFRRSNRNRHARELSVARREGARDAEDGESRIQRLVDELPSPYREVVHMRFYQDMSLGEIALELGRPAVTVRSQLARGLERLRARLGEAERPGWRRALLVWLGWRQDGLRLPLLVGVAGGLLLALLWFRRESEPNSLQAEERAASLPSAHAPLEPPTREALASLALDPASVAAVAQLPSGPTRRLTGRVLASDGSPQAGATLLGGTRSGSGRACGVTDAHGRFALDGLAPESFLWAEAQGHLASGRLYVRSLAAETSHDFLLPADQGALEVRLSEADGRPASGLTLVVDAEVGRAEQSVVTASGGLELVPHDSIRVRTDESGRARLRRPARSLLEFTAWRGPDLVLQEVVELGSEQGELALTLPRAPRLTGQVRAPDGSVASDVPIVVRQLDLDLYRVARTDARGRFSFEGLVPGEFGLQCEHAASTSAAVLRGTLAEGEVRELLVDTSAEMALAGTALDEHGPLAGAEVALFREGRPGLEADEVRTTGADGSFLLWVDPTVEYWLQLRRPGAALPCGLARHLRGGARVELRPEPELERSLPLTLRFTAERPEHRPTQIKLRCLYPRISVEAEVGADWCARLELPRGEYELAVWVPGLGFWRMSAPFVPDGGLREVVLPRPGRVELRLEPVDETYAPARASLRVGGFNPFGFQSLGAVSTEIALQADVAGRAFQAELFPGKASYTLELEGFVDSSGRLSVPAGERTELVLRPEAAQRRYVRIEFPRELAAGEGLELVATTPGGPCVLPVGGDVVRRAGVMQLVLNVPRAATALECRSSLGLAGSVPLGPGAPSSAMLVLPLR